MEEIRKFKKIITGITGNIFAILILGQLSPVAHAQSEIKISGRIIDEISGNPIAAVAVTIEEISETAISDIGGAFSFGNIPSGTYNINFSRIGYAPYRSSYHLSDRPLNNMIIRLSPVPLDAPSQLIIADHMSQIAVKINGNKTIIEIPDGKSISPEALIENIPELEIVNAHQKKILRFKGTANNAAIVMLDGRVMNSSLQAESDISGIPLNAISRVIITRGGDMNSSGLAGSFNFITGSMISKSTGHAGLSRGNHGLSSYAIGIKTPIGNSISIGGELEIQNYIGNFEYSNPRDSISVRRNNQSRILAAFGQLGYENAKAKISLKSRLYDRLAGIPGPMLQETPEARSDIEEADIYATLEYDLNKFVSMDATSGMTKRRAGFDSPQTPTNFIPYNSRFDEFNWDADLHSQYLKSMFTADLKYNFRHESLDGQDFIRPDNSFGYRSRDVNTIALSASVNSILHWLFIEDLSASVAARYDFGNIREFLSPSASFRINYSCPLSIGTDFSVYRSRRLPGMTDLYWKEDVFAAPNPDLEDEKAFGYALGIDFKNTSHSFIFSRIDLFRTEFEDIITWRRWAGDKYKPVNVSESLLEGISYAFETRPLNWPLKISWNGSFIKPLNKETEPTHFNKYLTFRPLDTQNASIDLEWFVLNLKLSGRHIGRRFTTEENTKSIPPVDLIDMELKFKYVIKTIDTGISFAVFNVGNIQYEMLERQPEKMREYKIALEFVK